MEKHLRKLTQLLAGLTLCFSAHLHAFPTVDYFPLPEGASWSYTRIPGNETIVSQVTGPNWVNGVWTTQFDGGTGDLFSYTNDAQGLRVHEIETGFPAARVEFTPPIRLANAEAFVGDNIQVNGTATFIIPGAGSNPISYTSTARLLSQQSTTVPYGTFTTVRLQWTLTMSGTIQGQQVNETTTANLYIAEGIGIVRDDQGASRLDLFDTNVELLTQDPDGDGIIGDQDNCPNTANADQTNTDGDALGDACDSDDDNDGVPDASDAFPLDPTEQSDNDQDGIGDNADTDDDNDDLPDSWESANGLNPFNASDRDSNADGDNYSNYQEYIGGSDPQDPSSIPQPVPQIMLFTGTLQQIPAELTSGPFSIGQNMSGAYVYENNKALNPDINGGSTIAQYRQITPISANVGGIDQPFDSISEIFIYGGDSPTVADGWESILRVDGSTIGAYQANSLSVRHFTGNGYYPTDELPDNPPDQNDFFSNEIHFVFFNGANSVWMVGDVDYHLPIQEAPGDFDADGFPNTTDNCPITFQSNQTDSDGDGSGNACDTDDDNDGVPDNMDAFPTDPTETMDSDGDGVGDNRDAFPNDANEQLDTDGDGIGNNADNDDDGDGLTDTEEQSLGTDPLLRDTDRDGLSDGQEIELGLNPLDPNDCPEELCPQGSLIIKILPYLIN